MDLQALKNYLYPRGSVDWGNGVMPGQPIYSDSAPPPTKVGYLSLNPAQPNMDMGMPQYGQQASNTLDKMPSIGPGNVPRQGFQSPGADLIADKRLNSPYQGGLPVQAPDAVQRGLMGMQDKHTQFTNFLMQLSNIADLLANRDERYTNTLAPGSLLYKLRSMAGHEGNLSRTVKDFMVGGQDWRNRQMLNANDEFMH